MDSTPAAQPPSTLSRILNVVRVQYVNTYIFVWVPLMVLGGSLLISLAIYAMIGSDEPMYGGGAQAPLWYFLVAGVQAMTLTFPFSQALSLTRREFFLGTMLAAALSAAGMALVFVLLGLIEQATDGYGINGYLFHLQWVWENGWASAAVLVFALVLFFFVIGFWFATLYRQYGTVVLTIVLIGLGVLLVAAAFVITRMEAWGDVVSWVAQLGPFGAAGVIGVTTVVLGIGSLLSLRRATP